MFSRRYIGLIIAVLLSAIPFLLPANVNAQTISEYFYDDAIPTNWAAHPWDQGQTYNLSNTNPVYAGQYSIAYPPVRDYGGLKFNTTSEADYIDLTPYSYFTFAARVTDATNPRLKFMFYDENMTFLDDIWILDIPTDHWQVYQIPIDADPNDPPDTLQIGYKRIRQIQIQNQIGYPQSYYLDEIGFGGSAPPPTPTPPPQNLPAELSVDASVDVNPFNEMMNGHALVNWEHSWNRPFPGEFTNLAQALEGAGTKLIRYAGGLWANYVGWERLPQRTPYGNYVPDPNNYVLTGIQPIVYNFHYGQDEIDSLAQLAQEIGSQVMIQVNISANNPQMWADMVHYTNVEHNYNFKYWEISNELDVVCIRGNDACITPAEYAVRLPGYIAAMKAVDPSIVIVGGVPGGADNDLVDLNSSYLESAAELPGIEALSWHWYQQCNNNTEETLMHWTYPGIPYDHPNIRYYRLWSERGPTRVNDEVIQPNNPSLIHGITELNYSACQYDHVLNGNHLNALWASDVIGRLAYNGLDFITWYEGYGTQGYSIIYPDDDYNPNTAMNIRPSYYTFYMYDKYFGDMMVQSSTDTINGSTDHDQMVSIWASKKQPDDGTLRLIVNNLAYDNIDATINLSGFNATGGTYYELTSTDPNDISSNSNLETAPTTLNGVTIDGNNVAGANIPANQLAVSGSTLVHTFPGYSITSIILTGEGGPTPSPTDSCTRKGVGDANCDDVIDIRDYIVLSNTFGSNTELDADFDSNGTVNIQDYIVLSNNFGS